MTRLGFGSLIAAFVAILVIAGVAGVASAGKPCARKTFKTVMVRDACQKGGQDEAKKQMKSFLTQSKKKNASQTCLACHTKVADDYPLKRDGLKLFLESGGK